MSGTCRIQEVEYAVSRTDPLRLWVSEKCERLAQERVQCKRSDLLRFRLTVRLRIERI
jgi:hypothetical protein